MNLRSACLVVLALLIWSASTRAESKAEYDIVIRNGRVLDGAGNPWRRADVAIAKGRIVRVGRVVERGRREIVLKDEYVGPGWIDMMDQSGHVLLKDGRAENKLRQGVTTLIAGEGGAPVPAAKLSEYFQRLETQGVAVNFATYYGAHQARTEVIGEGHGEPNAAQMQQMRARVASAMQAGAIGLATALIYPPASFQTTEDLIALARVASEHGGLFALHMRNEGAGLLDGVAEAIEIGERANVRIEIFHLKGAYSEGWGALIPRAAAMIDAARTRGVDVAADLYPYTAGGTWLAALVPNWVFAQGPEHGLRSLQDPAVRARVKEEMNRAPASGVSNLVGDCGGWDKIVLSNPAAPDYMRFRMQSIGDIARSLKREPADVALDIILSAAPAKPLVVIYCMDERDIEAVARLPWTSLATDADASNPRGEIIELLHPRAFGAFPRFIAEYVRKRRVLSLEDAVRKMTSLPAGRVGLPDRGLLAEGMWADITIFDFEKLQDRATYEEPTAFPEGIRYVLVNGAVVVEEARHTGALPGQVLRGAAWRASKAGR